MTSRERLSSDSPVPRCLPAVTTCVGGADVRSRVVLDVVVERVELASWAGGPALEVTVGDGTGWLILVFLGRREVVGLADGRHIRAAGTVGRHAGRRVMLNPRTWLEPLDGTGARP